MKCNERKPIYYMYLFVIKLKPNTKYVSKIDVVCASLSIRYYYTSYSQLNIFETVDYFKAAF